MMRKDNTMKNLVRSNARSVVEKLLGEDVAPVGNNRHAALSGLVHGVMELSSSDQAVFLEQLGMSFKENVAQFNDPAWDRVADAIIQASEVLSSEVDHEGNDERRTLHADAPSDEDPYEHGAAS